MHEIKSDNTFRGPSESMYFDRRCDIVHDLALKLEAKGFKTYGTNEELRCYIPSPKEEKEGINFNNLGGIVIEPHYEAMNHYGNVDNFENLIVYIRSVGLKVKTTMKDFKKTFDSKGMVVKAIHEYESTVEQLRKTMQDNLSMAVTLANT